MHKYLHILPCSVLLAVLSEASCTSTPDTTDPPLPVRVEFDPPGPKDPDLVARAVVFLGSCMSSGGNNVSPQSLIDNTYYTARADRPIVSALENTTHCFADKSEGCKSLDDCLAMTTRLTAPDEQCETTCLPGNISITCGAIQWRTECDRLGMECMYDGCAPYPRRGQCDSATIDLCEGNIPRHCPKGATQSWRGVACDDFGLVCGVIPVGDDSWSLCQGEGPECPSGYYQLNDRIVLIQADLACSGTKAETCLNKRAHAYDCGELGQGFTCQGTGKEAFCGLAHECIPGSTFETTCEGDKVVVCNGGRIDRVDCKELGFNGCDPEVGLCFPSPASKR